MMITYPGGAVVSPTPVARFMYYQHVSAVVEVASERGDGTVQDRDAGQDETGNSEEKMRVIYALVDPRTGLPRYIGQTSDPERRLNTHVTEALRGPPTDQKTEWIHGLHQRGEKPEIREIDKVPEALADHREEYLIRVFHDALGRVLLNEKLPRPSGAGPGPEDTWHDRPGGEEADMERLVRALARREEEPFSSLDIIGVASDIGLSTERVAKAMPLLERQGRMYRSGFEYHFTTRPL